MTETFLMKGEHLVGELKTVCVTLPTNLDKNSTQFALIYPDAKGNRSRLIRLALVEFMINHKGECTKPVDLTLKLEVQAPKQPKPEELHCQIGECHKKAITSGVYQGKEYQLCKTHANAYALTKGWLLK